MNQIKKIYKILIKEYNYQGWWPLSGLEMPVKDNDKDFPNYRKANPEGSEKDFITNWPRHLGIAPKDDNRRFEIIVGAILTQHSYSGY